jgi:Flp pilus assembly protein TadD
MSIIQDALKKAQEDRAKKNKREVPYHLSGVQRKPKTAIYVIAGLCVAAVFAWLYIPYFHKPKQIMQPVAVQQPVPVKPVQVTVNVPPISEAQKPVKETPAKKGESTIVSVSQKPAASMIPNNQQEPAGARIKITPVQKTAISPPMKRRTRVAEPAGTQNAMNEPVRVIEKKTDNGSLDSMYNEASREQQSGRTREAKTIYKQILAKQPSHIETLNNLGVIAIQEGNTQEALFYFKRILEYRKNYSKAYNNIGLIAMRDGDRQIAEEYLRKAISLEPDDPGPYVNLSALLRSQGRLQEAAKLLEIPIQQKAKDPDLLLSYAVIKDNLGQFEDAARYYRQYLSLIRTPASRKDIIERLQYIEGKR